MLRAGSFVCPSASCDLDSVQLWVRKGSEALKGLGLSLWGEHLKFLAVNLNKSSSSPSVRLQLRTGDSQCWRCLGLGCLRVSHRCGIPVGVQRGFIPLAAVSRFLLEWLVTVVSKKRDVQKLMSVLVFCLLPQCGFNFSNLSQESEKTGYQDEVSFSKLG